MKKSDTMKFHSIHLSILFLFAFPFCVWSQKYPTRVIENNYPLPAGKEVRLNLKFGTMIKVGVWDKRELGLKTTIMRSNPAMDTIHQLVVTQQEALSVTADFRFRKGDHHNYQCWNCDEDRDDGCNCFRVSYEVMLPADARLALETISGDIEIAGLRGPISAKSISGFVDVSLDSRAASDVSLKSVTGEIYTDFDIKLDENSSTFSKRLNRPLNGGGPKIALETVSGDIYFRKM